MTRPRIIFAFAAILIAAGALAAQEKTNFEHLQPYMGHWAKDGRLMFWEGQWSPFDQRQSCSPAVGGDNRCSIPLDKMRPFFHPRMLAWQQFAGLTDERLSGMFECAPTPLPSLLEDGWTVRPLSEGLMRLEYGWTSGGWIRPVYIDGRAHSTEYNRFTYMGEAVGHFEGDDLIIVTTNFTFDTDGLDDHLHLPSSMRKKITERYHLTAPDKLELLITQEDSLFLTKPLTWGLQFRKDEKQTTIHDLPAEITPCDPVTAHLEVELAKDKYRGK